MPTNRKDVYSAMPDSSFGGFGGIEREGMVRSPMRGKNPRRKRKKVKPREEKSLHQKDLMEQSFKSAFVKRINDIDDEALDLLFPEDDHEAVDKFVAQIDDKWIFDTAGAFIRRALTNRRRRRRRRWKSDDMYAETQEDADSYADNLHEQQARMYGQ